MVLDPSLDFVLACCILLLNCTKWCSRYFVIHGVVTDFSITFRLEQCRQFGTGQRSRDRCHSSWSADQPHAADHVRVVWELQKENTLPELVESRRNCASAGPTPLPGKVLHFAAPEL